MTNTLSGDRDKPVIANFQSLLFIYPKHSSKHGILGPSLSRSMHPMLLITGQDGHMS